MSGFGEPTVNPGGLYAFVCACGSWTETYTPMSSHWYAATHLELNPGHVLVVTTTRDAS